MAQILLVNAPVKAPIGDRHASLGPPIGLAYIGSVLIEQGFSVSALDLNLAWSDAERLIEMRMAQEAPSIMGISSRTPDFPQAIEVARLAKKIRSDLKIIVGGPHPTFLPEQVLSHEEMDVAVIGEGEETMLEIAQYYLEGRGDLAQIKGVAYRQNGKVKLTERREFAKNLDSLPIPARFLFPLSGYEFPFTVLTARGCPANCIFCSVNSLCGRRVRFRSVQQVVYELSSLFEDHYVKFINFIDDTFTVNRKRSMELCEALTGIPVGWSCATRVNQVDRELLETMSRARCKGINYGIESGSQSVLDSIGKGITLEQVREAIENTVELGMRPLCSFMVPHPTDDRDSILQTLEFTEGLKQLGCDISLNFTAPLPGTPLYDHREKYGIRIETDRWEDFDGKHSIMSTRCLDSTEVENLVDEWLSSHSWNTSLSNR